MKFDPVHTQPTPSRPRPARALWAAATVAATLVAGTSPATTDPPTVKVRYDDLNLASDAGTKALLRRLSAAADRVCEVGQARELLRVSYAEHCAAEALSRAVVAVHNERLSALYRARGSTGAT